MTTKRQDLENILDYYQRVTAKRYIILYKNKPIFFTKGNNYYSSEANARRVIMAKCHGITKEDIQAMINDGTLIIKPAII